jgi:membrane protein implicated in regulation of membrane protease activity
VNVSPIWSVVFTILIVVELVGCGLFVGLYTRTWPWWRNEMGRYTVAFSSCLLLFMLYYVLRSLKLLPQSIWVQLFLFITLVGVTYWQLILFLRIRREQRRQRRQAREVDRGEDAGN